MAEPLHGADERPPVGKRWGVLYAVVLGALAIEILFFWLFAESFR